MKEYTQIAIHSKRILLNNAEQQILQHLMEGADLSEQEALNQVISYKREQAFVQELNGQLLLAEQLLKEIDEWNDALSDHYDDLAKSDKEIYTG